MSHKGNAHSPARLAMLQWAARLGAVTAPALAQRDGCPVASARGRLQAAQRIGLLAASRPLTGVPTLYVPTRAGLLAAGSQPEETSSITASNAAHTATCAAVAAALERLYPDQLLTGERSLRRQEREHRGALASAPLRSGIRGSQLHRPDLVLWPADRQCQPLAVEVELTVKAPLRLLEICRAWARCRCVSGVLYVISPEVERPLGRAIDRARARDRIAVLGLDAVGDAAQDVGSPADGNVSSGG